MPLDSISQASQDDVLEVLHHNRERNPILSRFAPKHNVAFGFKQIDYSRVLQRFFLEWATLTPSDDTKIRANSAWQYLEINQKTDAASQDFIYGPEESMLATAHIVDDFGLSSAEYDYKAKPWLYGRGVLADQIERHQIFSSRGYPREFAIHLGTAIHPFLQKWVGVEIPELAIGVPCFNLDGIPLGVHNRLLSTVPKMKFSSSLPGILLWSNMRRGRSYKRIIVAEGVFDGFAAERLDPDAGIISPSSGHVSHQQLETLAYYLYLWPEAEVWWAFDHDRIGLKTSLSLQSAFQRGKIMDWKNGKDLAEAVCKYGEKEILELPTLVAKKNYREMPYQQLIDYSWYVDSRQNAYADANYSWNTTGN